MVIPTTILSRQNARNTDVRIPSRFSAVHTLASAYVDGRRCHVINEKSLLHHTRFTQRIPTRTSLKKQVSETHFQKHNYESLPSIVMLRRIYASTDEYSKRGGHCRRSIAWDTFQMYHDRLPLVHRSVTYAFVEVVDQVRGTMRPTARPTWPSDWWPSPSYSWPFGYRLCFPFPHRSPGSFRCGRSRW